MQFSFADRTFLVTGGGVESVKGVAAALSAAGANVMIMGRNSDRLSAAADEVNAGDGSGTVRFEPGDVRDEDQVRFVVEAAAAWTGRLNGVVHCAGGSETIGPITQIDSEAWRRTVDLNVNGTMYLIKPRPENWFGVVGIVRRNLVRRVEQRAPVVRRLRCQQVGA